MKVAVIHDWLETYAGSERVLEQMLLMYPDADLYTTVDFMDANNRSFIGDRKVFTSFIQRLPFAKSKFRMFLPFMPFAIEQFDLSKYELILSSSHAVAKGVLTGPDQLHISYVHTPIRYAWDMQHQYLKESGAGRGLKGWMSRYMLHQIRLWDTRTAFGVNHFVANSRYIARRIWKVYRRESSVIYPPVDIGKFQSVEIKEDFYLTASRMVPYKRMDLIVDAFTQMKDKRLIVIGQGPDFKKIAAKAGSNVELLGFQPFEVLKSHMERAKAFVFAAEEDFGIIPVEAQACGTPVIAYGKGGALETIRAAGANRATGLFFDEQSAESIMDAVQRFEALETPILPLHCRENAERFSEERFRQELRTFIADCTRQMKYG